MLRTPPRAAAPARCGRTSRGSPPFGLAGEKDHGISHTRILIRNRIEKSKGHACSRFWASSSSVWLTKREETLLLGFVGSMMRIEVVVEGLQGRRRVFGTRKTNPECARLIYSDRLTN